MGRNDRLFAAVALFSWLAGAGCAMAAERWEEAAGGAAAILPVPAQASGITGGSLYCAEQKWGFLFRTAGDVGSGPVEIGVEGRILEAEGVAAPGTLQVALPADSLAALKAGMRMRISAGPEEAPVKAIFNLRNSSKVIDAIAPRCSPIDMSAHEAVSLRGTGPAAEAATALFADEISLFREATGKDPEIAAAIVGRPDGKRLLFGSLCGSTRYYGSSGCTLHGWAADGTGDWQPAYATDGVHLYLDESRARDGWPGLATVATVNGLEPVHWTWRDGAYAAEGGALLAEDETGGADRTAR